MEYNHKYIREPQTIKNFKLYHASFPTLIDLREYLLSDPPINTDIFNSENLASNRSNLLGCDASYEEAVEQIGRFHKQGMEEFLTLSRRMSERYITTNDEYQEVLGPQGFMVDIPSYVAGSPDCMIDIVQKQVKKFITIYFSLLYPSQVKREQVWNRGLLSLDLIRLLNNQGYCVNLKGFALMKVDNELGYITVGLKDYNEFVNTGICFFPCCVIEFGRRALMRVLETMPFTLSNWRNSYGVYCKYDEVKEYLQIPDTDIVISTPNEMGIKGSPDPKDDAESFYKTLKLEKYIQKKR